MSSLLTTLEKSQDLRLAEWQNSVGVSLLSSADAGEISCYDHLISGTTKLANRSSVYKREAFLCFKDSKKLGSIKGAFNLGICHEQGLGTSVNIDKVSIQSSLL